VPRRLRARLRNQIAREAAQLASGQPGSDVNAVRLILALLDRGTQLVQLGELASLPVREEQMDGLEAVGEPLGDPLTERAQALAAERGDLHRVREAIRQPAALQGIDRVDLVDHNLERQLVGSDVVQDCRHGACLFLEKLVRRGCVHDVQDEVRNQCLLECRGEALDELGRKAPDEADRVRDQIPAALVLECARRRIERFEQSVIDRHVGLGERVQKRRLADVRVAGERDRRRLRPLALLPPNVALFAEVFEPTAEESDPAPRDPPVALELGFTWAASADARSERSHAAAEAFEVLPHASHAREVVLELRELHLELAFGTSCVLGEDVEDQLRAIDDARLKRVLERSLLRGLELVVDQQHLCVRLAVGALELIELPLADVGPLLRARAMLDELTDRFDERGVRELSQLGQLLFRVDSLSQHRDDEPTLQRGVRLALDHDRIMPSTRQNPHMASQQLSPALAATGTYPFVKLEEAKRRLAAEGVELIDFGKGDPREPTDWMIRRAVAESLTEISTYPLAEGLPELRSAVAGWCRRRFGVELDPDTEIIPTYGSKEAIFLLAQVIVDRDADKRLVLTTEPGYPVPDRGAAFAGADVVQLPLLEANGFVPDLQAVDPETWEQAAIVWINYPNNPTGAVAPLDFLARIAELSREHAFLLACDEAYTELWFDDPPHSALEVREFGNVAVFNTLSKRSSMTGYRSGFVAAEAELIRALKQFRPTVGTAPQEFVQRASVVAWNDEEHVERTRDTYRRKREALLPTLARKGIRLPGGAATMFLWLEVPNGESSESFAARLLGHGLIVSPGTFFGPAGEGYWRLALVPTEEECRRAARIFEEIL
jgi:succinyldiaminopimelate transaminase